VLTHNYVDINKISSGENDPGGSARAEKMNKRTFGKNSNGVEIELYALSNKRGMQAIIITLGATVVSLDVPDKRGEFADVVLGYNSLAEYLTDVAYLGAILGRHANRIAKGQFRLGDVTYTLARNNGENHVHGGIRGFDKVVWTARDISTDKVDALELTYLSKDLEEGYPGNMSVRVVYAITPENELKIDYFATSDKDTVVNLTNHSYFNLGGHASGDILQHELMINADRFTPTDSTSIPTGELRSVKDTPFDFTRPTEIGLRASQSNEQLAYGHGYDQNFVLNQSEGVSSSLGARVRELKSGRVLEVWTSEPGMQLYCGNYLDGTIKGKSGTAYQKHQGFCLETQHFPDSPNQPNFPSTVLKAGAQFRSTTIFKFFTQ
jgi:aldose 1-epimerase